MSGRPLEHANPLLNHVDLFHLYFWTDDIDRSMAALSEKFGLTWLPINRGIFPFRSVDGDGGDLDVTWTFSLQGPPYIELGHVSFARIPDKTDLVNPQHYGYWCDDVAGTRDGLIELGWTLEYETDSSHRRPSSSGADRPWTPFLRSPAGALVELNSGEGRAGFLERQGFRAAGVS
jgi:hypothetical protein